MKHFRTMLVGVGIGLGGVALGSLPGQPTLQADGKRPTIPVAVENTPTVNVGRLPAITGSVSITGQPVSVNVNTLPAVQLAPGTTVGVTGGNFTFSNTASTPIFTRDKDNAAFMPFQRTLCVGGTNESLDPCHGVPRIFSTPAGKELVIEFFSTFCVSNASGFLEGQLILFTTAGGFNAGHFLHPGQPDTVFPNDLIANQQTRIYADPGTDVVFSGFNTQPSQAGSVSCSLTLSGYLVTL